MKVNVKQVITDGRGTELELAKGIPLTLALVCERALNTPPGDKPLSYSDSMKRGMLALQFGEAANGDGEMELDQKERTMIQELLPLGGWTTMVVARAGTMLNDVKET